MKLNKWTLKIMDRSLSKKYKLSQKKSMIVMARLDFIFLLTLFFIYTLLDFLFRGDLVSGYYKLGILIFFVMCFLFTFSDYYQHIYNNFILVVISLAIFVKIIFDWSTDSYTTIINTVLVSFLSATTLIIDIQKILIMNIIHVISFTIRYFTKFKIVKKIIRISVLSAENFDLVRTRSTVSVTPSDFTLINFFILFIIIILLISVTSMSLYYNFKIEKEKRTDFLAKAKDNIEISIRQEILSILVPKFVKDQLNQGNRTMQQNQDMVTILFCDLCDFDKMISVEDTKIVQLLDSLFRAFDGYCLKYGVQKIEVIKLLFFNNFSRLLEKHIWQQQE